MRNTRKTAIPCGLILAGFLTWAIPAQCQLPSPPAKAACKFQDGKTIEVNYSSPRMRGRKIFGDLVPFGEEWRVGADEATAFVTTADLIVGGKNVPAGRYTLFALPARAKWMLIISKKIGEWGIPYPGKQRLRANVARKEADATISHVEMLSRINYGTATVRVTNLATASGEPVRAPS